MKKRKLNYPKFILANLFILVLYLFIAIQLSYDLLEQILFAFIFALSVIFFNIIIIERD